MGPRGLSAPRSLSHLAITPHSQVEREGARQRANCAPPPLCRTTRPSPESSINTLVELSCGVGGESEPGRTGGSPGNIHLLRLQAITAFVHTEGCRSRFVMLQTTDNLESSLQLVSCIGHESQSTRQSTRRPACSAATDLFASGRQSITRRPNSEVTHVETFHTQTVVQSLGDIYGTNHNSKTHQCRAHLLVTLVCTQTLCKAWGTRTFNAPWTPGSTGAMSGTFPRGGASTQRRHSSLSRAVSG